MRILALILAACAATTLNWSAAGHSAPTAGVAEQRLPHISITTMGKGDPVVLIPGLSTPRAVWDQIAPGLARSNQVILVQVNGFAGDDAGANTQAGILDGIVSDLHSYLAGRSLTKVRLIGHSMGGLTALKFARAHPESVDRVMIVDALPFFAVLMDPAATPETVRPTAEVMRKTIASAYGKPADPQRVEASVRSLALKPESMALMKQWAAKGDPRVTAQALYEDLTTDFRPQLANVTTPLIVVVPWTKDRFGEERTIAFYKREYAGAAHVSFVGIGEGGHFVMLDQPQAFAAAVDAFLK